MSEIYLTVTQGGLAGFQKLIVLKLLRRDLVAEDEFRRMFLDEACLAARLNHPNVVQTYDVGEDHGRYYIAMEYLEGQTFERVRRSPSASRRFPLDMQIQMLSHVLSGLHYAHALPDYDDKPISIVHRDVTPSNVMITYDGQVKLLDFGIAKVLDSVQHTRVGVLKGKARYMSPEQVSGAPIDRRADIYSAGVMLWEMLAGKHIWGGLPETEILRRSGEVPALPPEVPARLQQICMTAMAPRAEDRFSTAEALRAELELYLGQNTGNRDRDLGAAVSELFSEERTRIRQIIDTQMKEHRPGTRLPAFRDLRVASPGSSMFDTPAGASAPSRDGSSVQLAYSGVNLPTPAAFPPPRRRRTYAIAGAGALVVAILAIAMVTRGGAKPGAVPDEPGPAVASVKPEPPATPPEAPRAAVRGVTDHEITLGMSAAFSGASRELGNRMKLGLETAFARANDAGGVGGRSIKLLALDDGYEGARAVANVQELVEQRNVFAIIGDVGTPTTKEALPYTLAKKVIFFGALTGSSLLRRDPPDRYVFNYRASYEEETAKMVNYLVDVKKVPEHDIVVFAQNDSYGDAGFDGATKMLRKRGKDDAILRVGYDRNTLNVDDAVNKVVEYHTAVVRSGDSVRSRHPVKAIVVVATYKAAARFIQKIRDHKIDATFLNVSFVGSDSLSEELRELGPSYSQGVIVTQVVPHYDSQGTGVLRYRDALKKYHPDQQPDFVSLEGFIVGELFIEGLRRAGRDLDTEKLVEALEGIHDLDLGIGGSLGFTGSMHQASHKVWGTQLDEHGMFRSIDME